jgi:hypothetical protein
MTYGIFSTRALAAEWLQTQLALGLHGYILKDCDGCYTARAWS